MQEKTMIIKKALKIQKTINAYGIIKPYNSNDWGRNMVNISLNSNSVILNFKRGYRKHSYDNDYDIYHGGQHMIEMNINGEEFQQLQQIFCTKKKVDRIEICNINSIINFYATDFLYSLANSCCGYNPYEIRGKDVYEYKNAYYLHLWADDYDSGDSFKDIIIYKSKLNNVEKQQFTQKAHKPTRYFSYFDDNDHNGDYYRYRDNIKVHYLQDNKDNKAILKNALKNNYYRDNKDEKSYIQEYFDHLKNDIDVDQFWHPTEY